MSQHREWVKTRKKWIKENPPIWGGYWYCVIGGRALTDDPEKLAYGALPLTLDHDIARSRDQSLRHELDNLNPMCGYHNSMKGSRNLYSFKLSKPPKACLY